jgi:hypothetical protein
MATARGKKRSKRRPMQEARRVFFCYNRRDMILAPSGTPRSIFFALTLISAHGCFESADDDDSTSTSVTSATQTDSASTSGSTTENSGTDGSTNTTATSTASTTTDTSTPDWWKPTVGQSWHIQYTGDLDTSVDVQIYNVDLFDTSAEAIANLHHAGRKVMCYFSAGSFEDWRPDTALFPPAVLGKDLDGWEGEKWLDIRNLTALTPIMGARLDLAREKGCDGVDPDNVNGYENETGFPLSGDDQLAFNRWLAGAAHERGLGVGLKNDVDQVAALLGDFDWQVNEECFTYGECEQLLPFIHAAKPVFHIEYVGESDVNAACQFAAANGFSTIFKNLDLDAWMMVCPTP